MNEDPTFIMKQLSDEIKGLSAGMYMHDALKVILDEVRRLKEIEWKYEELCK